MAKHEQGKSVARPNQKLPGGHFNSNGESQGKQEGPVRPTKDAYQGERKGQSK